MKFQLNWWKLWSCMKIITRWLKCKNKVTQIYCYFFNTILGHPQILFLTFYVCWILIFLWEKLHPTECVANIKSSDAMQLIGDQHSSVLNFRIFINIINILFYWQIHTIIHTYLSEPIHTTHQSDLFSITEIYTIQN